jgi:hypothetical protein
MIAGADLSRARGLTQEQLDDACGDSRTRLPSGLVARCSSGRITPPRIHIAVPTPPAAPRYLVEVEPNP